MAAVAAAEVELGEWVEVAVVEAAADRRSLEEDMAAVVAPGRRAFPVHRALHGQVLAGPAEWLRTGTSEVAM